MERYCLVIDYIPHTVPFILETTLIFCNWKFIPLNLTHIFFTPLPQSKQAATCFILYNSCSFLLYLFIYFDFSIPLTSEIIQCLSFSVWVCCRSIHVLQMMRFHSFLFLSNITVCMCVCVCVCVSSSVHYLYLFIYW